MAETRRDLAVAAYELANERGWSAVRVPDIAARVGVSTRTFNNYFPSREAALCWPASRRGDQMAAVLGQRPAGEALPDAVAEAVLATYTLPPDESLPKDWLPGFRALVAAEPALTGEYLRAAAAGEDALAVAIAGRLAEEPDGLRPRVLAAAAIGAERAAVRQWLRHPSDMDQLRTLIRAALAEVLR